MVGEAHISPMRASKPCDEVGKGAVVGATSSLPECLVRTVEQYEKVWKYSVEHSEKFWETLSDAMLRFKSKEGVVKDEQGVWFPDASMNVCDNCVDRWVREDARRGTDSACVLWEQDGGTSVRLSRRDVLHQVCSIAHYLKRAGVQKGDVVAIYMPNEPRALFAMLACARLGAVHNVTFSGYSAEKVTTRLNGAKVLLTQDWYARAGRVSTPLSNVAEVLGDLELQILLIPCVSEVEPVTAPLVTKAVEQLKTVLGAPSECAVEYVESDCMEEVVAAQRGQTVVKTAKKTKKTSTYKVGKSTVTRYEEVDTWEPCADTKGSQALFILNTSGSTGQPKAILHRAAGYLLYACVTSKYSFDMHTVPVETDARACAAAEALGLRGLTPGTVNPALADEPMGCLGELGWITGHSYLLYGPLANGVPTLCMSSTVMYPDGCRVWRTAARHGLAKVYLAPTALRMMQASGGDPACVANPELRLVGSVGECLNESAFLWLKKLIAPRPIVDTYWQTETGGHLLCPLPGLGLDTPKTCGKPFFGILPLLVQHESEKNHFMLTIASPWPGLTTTIYQDHARLVRSYFQHIKTDPVALPHTLSYIHSSNKALFGPPTDAKITEETLKTVPPADKKTDTLTLYATGDGATLQGGKWYIGGRLDDTLNVTGHRIGVSEVESAASHHPAIADVAVSGIPHALKGDGIVAYVVPKDRTLAYEPFCKELNLTIRKHFGPIGRVEHVVFCTALPKTNSGKIMRRLLNAYTCGKPCGELTGLAKPYDLEKLKKECTEHPLPKGFKKPE